MRPIFSIIIFFSMLIYIKSQTESEKNLSNTFQRLASLYCFIDDYPAWLEEQSILNYFVEIAELFHIDIAIIEQDLERYRLQRECLRVFERLPVVFGRG